MFSGSVFKTIVCAFKLIDKMALKQRGTVFTKIILAHNKFRYFDDAIHRPRKPVRSDHPSVHYPSVAFFESFLLTDSDTLYKQ